MTDGEIATQLIEALNAAAEREAGARTGLVSVAIEMLSAAESGGVAAVELQRKTRTLIFMSADYLNAAGARLATASSVHQVLA